MKDKLIAELREWAKYYSRTALKEIDEILSRHEYAEFKLRQCHESEQGEGNVGSLISWIDDQPEKVNKTLLKHKIICALARPTPDKAVEPLAVGSDDNLEHILAQVDYQIATGSAFELEILRRFKLIVECAVARKNAICAYWDKKSGKITYMEMCEKIKEFGKREEEITK